MPSQEQGSGRGLALYRRYKVVALVATVLVIIAIPTVIETAHLHVSWPAILGALVSAAVAAAVAAAVPGNVIGQGRLGKGILYGWSLVDIGAIGAGMAGSGGARSWFWVVLVLTTIFFCVGYPPRGQLVLLVATLATFATASFAAGGPVPVALLTWEMAVLVVAFGLASFPASELRREASRHRRAREEADHLAAELGEQEAWWRSLIERTSDPVLVFDQDWNLSFASPAFESLVGLQADLLHQPLIATLAHPDDQQALLAAVASLTPGSGERVTCRVRGARGDWRDLEVSISALPGSPQGWAVANIHDVTDRVAAEAVLARRATHDALTDLPNRAAFFEALGESLGIGAPLSVLVLDLEGFKEVNDSFGHAVGDQLLCELSRRLSSAVGKKDLVARLGGDEFAVLSSATAPDVHSAAALARRLLERIEEPIVLAGRPSWLRASVGIACTPVHGADPDELVRRADRAMYEAKRWGTSIAVYDPAMDASGNQIAGLLNDLRLAAGKGELRLYYQPKVSLPSERIVGVEALIRWQHPRLGLLEPSSFLPMAEASGVVRELTAWVLPEALGDLARWRDEGWDLSVAVNLSAQDLVDDLFPDLVTRRLQQFEIPGDKLVLELTEASAIADRQRGSAALGSLHQAGIRVSLDDFGTGYSSLAYLATLPLDELKLDRGFLEAAKGTDGFMLRSVVAIGHHLGLSVVGEGVETDDERDSLAAAGIDSVQGYFYSPPVPAERMIQLLDEWSHRGTASKRIGTRRPDPGRHPEVGPDAAVPA